MSPESRANIGWILDEVYPHILETVERERHLDPARWSGSLQGSHHLPDALAAGLVDRLAYWDEVEQRLLSLPG